MSEVRREIGAVPLAVQRLRLLASNGFNSDTDVAWFTGTNGLLEVCRLEASGQVEELEQLDGVAELLFDLDDRLAAIPAPSPSARARSLIAAAVAHDETALVAARRQILASVVGEQAADALARMLAAGVDDLLRWLRVHKPLPAPKTQAAAVAIAVSTHARGELVRLNLRRAEGLLPSIAPDLVEAPFQRFDRSFLGAMLDAYSAVGATGSYRFDVASLRTGVPLDAVVGRSGGLGAAVVLRTLERGSKPLDEIDWIFTGDVAASGSVEGLSDGIEVGPYRQKLEAASGRTLMAPRADAALLGPLVAEHRVELLPVDDVAEAAETIDRHLRALDSYHRVLAGRRRRRLAPLAALLAAAVLVGVGAFLLWNAQRADSGQRAIEAENPLVLVPATGAPDVPGPFRIARTETTNSQYLLCVQQLACPAPNGQQARPLTEAGNGGFPVTGVSAAEAEIYCSWAYGRNGGLPTFHQFRAALLSDPGQFPFGRVEGADPTGALSSDLPTQLLPVTDVSLARQQLRGLAGNAAEWTRTACVGETCANVASVNGTSPGFLRVFGIAYPYVELTEGPAWLMEEGKPDQLVNPARPTDDLSFRCVTEDVS